MSRVGASAAIAILAIGCVAIALVRYELARVAWREHGAAIGTATYDASASDAAYRTVEDALTWVERSSRAAAAIVVAAGVLIGRARPRRSRSDTTRARRIAARAIDAGSLALVLAASRVRVSSPGATEALAWIVPAAMLAALLGLAANGATLGDRVAAAKA